MKALAVWPFCVLLACAACGDAPPRPAVAGGEAQRGRVAMERYGCTACHRVPGLTEVPGFPVGPPLSHIADRGYIAGVLPNTPENLVRWLQHPTQVDPRTAMPELGLTRAEAADIAAYLYARN